MSFILTRGTGARMTDRRMTASRPQYDALMFVKGIG
jgi:hypothetical protein